MSEMGRSDFREIPGRESSSYDQAREILGFDLAAVCFDGPAEQLDTTIFSQPAACLSASLAALEMLRKPKIPRLSKNVRWRRD